jgi:hypothetical protein
MSQSNASSLRIMGAALLAGASLFLVVALVLPSVLDLGAESSPENRDQMLLVLSGAHALLAVSTTAMAFLLPPRLAAAQPDSGDAQLQSYLIKWALLEGAAMFGIVIVLLAGMQGALPGEPVWYANLASYGLLAAVLISDLTGDLSGNLNRAPD